MGIEYTFNTTTTDPDGDYIYYLVDWGDGTNSGWIGAYSSGKTVNATHIWTEEGDYEIRVKSHDCRRESNWSESHHIKIRYEPRPELRVSSISGGLFKVKAAIKNIGDAYATNVHWRITIEGGIILIGRNTTGVIPNIPSGMEEIISSTLIIGLGSVRIKVEVWIGDKPPVKREQGGSIFLIFIKVNPGG